MPNITSLKRKVLATSALAAALVALPVGGAPASASGGGPHTMPHPNPPTRNDSCVTYDGINLNEVLGVSHRIVQQPFCTDVIAGERYTPVSFWYTAASYDEFPSPYPLAGATPMEDFLSKFVAMRYVIDPGTRQARAYRFEAADIVSVHTMDTFFPGAPALPVAFFTTELPPLPPGGHSFELVIEMRAGHCDGLGTERGNCFAEGETDLGGCPFDVIDGASRWHD